MNTPATLTPEEEKQFSDFGCACRCLIAIANAAGASFSKNTFLERFPDRYQQWKAIGMVGATDTAMILEMALSLGLARGFQVFIDKAEVRKRFAEKKARTALLFTEKRPEKDGTFSPYFHCQLVSVQLSPNSQFVVHQVNDDLSVRPGAEVSDARIDALCGYFMLFY